MLHIKYRKAALVKTEIISHIHPIKFSSIQRRIYHNIEEAFDLLIEFQKFPNNKSLELNYSNKFEEIATQAESEGIWRR